jgi:sugar lactone lactonase YvrE
VTTPSASPDDLAVSPAGTLWISDPDRGVLTEIALPLPASGAVAALRTIANANRPEGMVVLGDGRIVLAEQRTNRIVVLDPRSPAPPTLVAQLPNRSGADGVDGIALDAERGLLLVPNSPDGTLLTIPVAGGPPVTVASGLGRAVGAVATADGIFVASEAAAGLLRVPAAGGQATRIGRLSVLDDVIVVGGLLYVTSLEQHAVLAVDPASGDSRTLVTGIAAAQGLVLLPDGQLAVSDSSRRAVAVFPAC